MVTLMRRTILTAAVLLIALPASANDAQPRCLSVLTDAGVVVGSSGDTTADEITFTQDGSGLVFTFADGSTMPAVFDTSTVDVTACTTGQVFVNGPQVGQDAHWTATDDETPTAATVVAPVVEVEIIDALHVELVLETAAAPVGDPILRR